MISFDNISYSVAGRPLVENTSVTIPTGHKVGLVGRNGTGKTTLFRVIRGEIPLDTGTIKTPIGARIGGIAQEVPGNDISLIDTVLACDTEREELMKQAQTATEPNHIAHIQTRLADIDAWSGEARASTILKGLGFDAKAQLKPCSAFSGGWRMRVALAGVLFSQPDLLLLDEPTNYLDLEGALWLENYLAKYPYTVIIVSHDRALLNRSVGSILHLEDKKLTFYNGPYDTFVKTRSARLATAESEAKKQEARRAHLQSYVDRFRYKADKAKQAQSRIKMIEKMEPITAPSERALRKFTFTQPEELSPPIVSIENGAVGYDETIILSKINLRIDQDDRIALLGQNGEGKSTLSKFIYGKLQAMEGRVVSHKKLRIGYFAQHQVDELFLDETPIDHIRRLRPDHPPAKLRAILGGFGIGAEQAETLVGQLSGGQKARLSLLIATIDAPHMLILDEPTNHLDIESREALIEALTQYSGAVILVSHDMHLLSLVADRLWLVKDGRVNQYHDDLQNYRTQILSPEKSQKKHETTQAPKAKKRPSRDVILELRANLRRAEERMEKLLDMQEKLADKLSKPELYEDTKKGELEVWNKKYAEVCQALERAEGLWDSAQKALDQAIEH